MTNAPSNPLYTVMVFGKFKAIDHNLVRFPDYVEVGTANCSSKISRVIEIERNGKVPVGDIKITSSQKWIEVVTLTKESSEIRIKVTVIVPKGINVINEEILVEGNYENDFVRIPVKGIVLPPIRVSPEMVLVTPHKSEYHLAVKTYTNSMPKLVSHDFKGNGLKIMCFKARPERIVVSVDRKKSYKGFAKGKLLLQYEGNAEPIEIIFVSAPLTPSPQRSNNKLSVD